MERDQDRGRLEQLSDRVREEFAHIKLRKILQTQSEDKKKNENRE